MPSVTLPLFFQEEAAAFIAELRQIIYRMKKYN
jgi:hypothetical protein